ncbi:MAG: hypothetical protein MUO59_03250 [Actinobacteria bacterium]|nr:hypothetical protein [Actinomycetota bacterium]
MIFRLFELSMGARDEINFSMLPCKLNNGPDYLNLSHRIWIHPCCINSKSDASFWDFYRIALDKAKKFMDFISDYLESGSLSNGIAEMIGNISYSTGIECGNSSRLKYFNSIYD